MDLGKTSGSKFMNNIMGSTCSPGKAGYLDKLVVALASINFENLYKKSGGEYTVHESTPPNLDSKARLALGYPAMIATEVTLSYVPFRLPTGIPPLQQIFST